MHPKLLESTIAQCRAHMEAGDCHGEAPPVERLIAAVVQLSQSVTLTAEDAKFLAARLRRLCAHHNYELPKFATDDASLINIAGSVIGALLTNATPGVAEVHAPQPDHWPFADAADADDAHGVGVGGGGQGKEGGS
jgi:hypothetical protein